MNTPDTEWEKQFNKDFGVFKWEESAKEKHTGEILSSTREVFPCEGGYCDMDVSSIKEFITNLLSSRDTYWKERVQKEVRDAYEHAEIVRQRTLNEIRQAVEEDESYGGAKECVYKILDRY